MRSSIKSNRSKPTIEFIEGTLIGTLGSMLPKRKRGYPYELFILIAIGIEFLGACEDQYGWNKEKRGLSRTRFYAGLDLFPDEYHKHKAFLYKKLRCGMAHIFAPAAGLGLGENKWKSGNLIGTSHKQETISLQLNIQSFYGDFRKACEKVVRKIKKAEYPKNSKVYKSFLSVPVD